MVVKLVKNSLLLRLAVCLVLAITLFSGCVKNEVKITFSFPKEVTLPCRILYYASGKGGGMIRETVAEISDGKGEVTLPERYPSLLYLFSPSGREPAAVIYVTRGDEIKISGTNADIESWEVKGSEINEAVSAWRIANRKAVSGKNSDEINKAVADFVKTNPDSPAAALILYIYYDRRENWAGFIELRDQLGAKVMGDEELFSALSAADLLTDVPLQSVIPDKIILVGESGYTDTVKIKGEARPAFLIFRRQSQRDYSLPGPDSLKSVIEKRKNARFAELYADPDSTGWRRYIAGDTIRNLKRLWLPLGTSDSLARRMGVRRMPYYLVVSSDGKPAYQGDDWGKALKELDRLSTRK